MLRSNLLFNMLTILQPSESTTLPAMLSSISTSAPTPRTGPLSRPPRSSSLLRPSCAASRKSLASLSLRWSTSVPESKSFEIPTRAPTTVLSGSVSPPLGCLLVSGPGRSCISVPTFDQSILFKRLVLYACHLLGRQPPSSLEQPAIRVLKTCSGHWSYLYDRVPLS